MWKTVRAIPDWFFELFNTCPDQPDGRWKDRDVMIVAHRGAACDEPENTIASFETALDKHRCVALELDLCMTRDGQIVVWHDWDPTDAVARARQEGLEEDVRCRPVTPNDARFLRPVDELDLAVLREQYGYGLKSIGSDRLEARIPTLDEFLEWAGGRDDLRHVHFDIKIPASRADLVVPMLDRIDALLEKHRPSFRWLFSTPHMPILEAMEKRSFHPNYAYDVETPFGIVLRPSRFSSVRTAIRFKNAFATSMHPKVTTLAPWTTYKRIIRADVRLREAHNRRHPEVPIERVFAATINERDLIRCLVAIGVDGLITDCPEIVREEVERAGRRAC